MAAVSQRYTMRPVIPADRSDSCGRVTINNIPQGVTEAKLKANLSHHGDVKIHMFVPGCEYSAGWAWVSFGNRDGVVSVLQTAYEKSHAREKLESIEKAEKPVEESDKENAATSEGEGNSSYISSDCSEDEAGNH
ncbi:hypothetical protein BESB_079610 [Besnoitia besnoiti]|uniref:RL domain-containing protein n=1 Tax=Besnoitia besnoiti TaxID=94643 RepID=A0A2A9M6W9_BESBE|nr:hypothetical protein BESB_079610 [Besnoitia besnoiti]PFH33745.1 hypothetical protein BESB_079610 [Besnoitia besnoiti]